MKTLVSWSTGKDSAWALHRLAAAGDSDVAGLFCTINRTFERTAMHAVRLELLQTQAARLDLPLEIVEIPWPCSNADYEAIMESFVARARAQQVECFVFGDLFLEDIRDYRLANLEGTGITPVFPLWQEDTAKLAGEMVEGGLKAVVTCVDPAQLDRAFAGRQFDAAMLADLPPGVDPCGENGEFHTFVYDAPAFSRPIDITMGDIVERDGFVFADVMPAGGKIAG